MYCPARWVGPDNSPPCPADSAAGTSPGPWRPGDRSTRPESGCRGKASGYTDRRPSCPAPKDLRSVQPRSRAFPQGIVADVKERTVLDDAPAGPAAELVPYIFGLSAAIEEIARVQVAVAKIVISEAMPVIRSATGDDVHLPARIPSVLGAVTVGGDLEFLDGVHRRLEHEPVHILIVVIDAVEQIVVVLLAASIGMHGERAAGGKLGILDRRQHAWREQRKLQEIALVEGQAVDAALVDHRA